MQPTKANDNIAYFPQRAPPELATRLRAAAAAIRRDAVNAFYLEVADLMETAARSLEDPRQSIYVTRGPSARSEQYPEPLPKKGEPQ